MQLEFHQLERRWEHLRVRDRQRQRRLLASLADSGQQVPIVVVVAEGGTPCLSLRCRVRRLRMPLESTTSYSQYNAAVTKVTLNSFECTPALP